MFRRVLIAATLGLGGGASDELSKGINAFSWDLYGQMALSEHNFVASPMNLSTSLAMAYVGAEGTTAEQMAKTLHYPTGPFENVASGFKTLVDDLGQAAKGAPFALQLAAGIWLDQRLELREDYKSALSKNFPGSMHEVDFVTPGTVITQANRWAADETEGMVSTLLNPGDIDPSTQLLLLSTLYFKAPWRTPFHPHQTVDGVFHLDQNQVVNVPMMHQVMEAAYLSDTDYDLLGMHYAADPNGAEFALVIILPHEVDGLAALEKMLTSQWLSAHLIKMVPTKVAVQLPRFSIQTRLPAESALQALGMTRPFSAQADFSGITTGGSLFLQKVIHEAFITVAEEGTTAGAASAATLGLTSAPVDKADAQFKATHPFAFAIMDFNSAQVLFAGRLLDPTHP